MPRSNAFSRNANAINLKIFPKHGEIYKFERNFNKHSGERKGCIHEANFEGQEW